MLGRRRKNSTMGLTLFVVAVLSSLGGNVVLVDGAAFLGLKSCGAVPSNGNNCDTPFATYSKGSCARRTNSAPPPFFPSSSALAFSRQDNLVSGLASISFAFSLGVFFSELAVVRTGCGPADFSDALERVCYQGLIVSAGLALFNRIVSRKSLGESADDYYGPLEAWTLVQVDVAEYSSALGVLGAFLALAAQYYRGVDMDGLSGIDIDLCRAIQDL